MSVTPTVLPNTDSSALWANDEYHYWQTVGNEHHYSLAWVSAPGVFGGWVNSADPSAYAIKVDTTTDTWDDYGSNHPHNVTDGATVVLDSGAGLTFYKFTKPTTASWISSGGSSGGSGATPHSVGSGIDRANFGGASAVGVTETWTVRNGTNTGGSSYSFYLYDSTPTGTPVATLTFPFNTPGDSVRSGTFTTTEGTYYIGYGDGATRVNLAQRTYPARRVPRGNFW
jgi:hypothetical protein